MSKALVVTYVHKAMYSVQNRPREGELVVNGMKVTWVNSMISGVNQVFWHRTVMLFYHDR